MAFSKRDISIVKGMLARGDRQHDIAAFFGVNGGRVADVATGKNGQGVVAADKAELPPPGPYMAGRSAMRARDTLIALRDLIDEAIKDIDKFEKLDKT